MTRSTSSSRCWTKNGFTSAGGAGRARAVRAGASEACVGGGRRPPAPPATFAMLVGVSMIGVALHVLLDFPTSYGSRPLSPFDWHWFALDWMPIVDIYLLLV